ncbi:hypothetical protein OS493_032630 [Desmophyllum pertusum]|uniref:Uncharacterized protein n=1 Tax=Desmophyllum pertusum TaxID=174260 RepID=A0A9W9YML9_9CNID|nr:hypothetical protein OS493_032630 [Desmophyllum pertusum]
MLRTVDDIQESGEILMLPSYIAVVAIDFGTTFSGFAFAFNNKEGEKSIHMNKEWEADQGCSTLKYTYLFVAKSKQEFQFLWI